MGDITDEANSLGLTVNITLPVRFLEPMARITREDPSKDLMGGITKMGHSSVAMVVTILRAASWEVMGTITLRAPF
jgi:hypothetical protein